MWRHTTEKKVQSGDERMKIEHRSEIFRGFFADTVRELLTHVPGNAKSELPSGAHHALAPELAGETDLGPLHMAAFSGSEDVVRVLLNSSGVNVEGASKPSVS